MPGPNFLRTLLLITPGQSATGSALKYLRFVGVVFKPAHKFFG